jgi:hypothetical protein
MKRIPLGDTGHEYDDLIVKLAAQGRLSFDRQIFRKICDREGLLGPEWAALGRDARGSGPR